MPNYTEYLTPTEARRIAKLDAMKIDIYGERKAIVNRAKQRKWRAEQASNGKPSGEAVPEMAE